MNPRIVAACTALALAAACNSSYTPRRGPRISITTEDGAPTLVKNGVSRPLGVLGGGLPEMVADHPVALEHAEQMHTRMTTGFVMVIAGAVALGASTALLPFDQRDPDSSSFVPAATAMAAGFGLYIGGLAMILTGEPHLYDAINVYNDDVDLRLQGLPSGFGSGAPVAAPEVATPTAP